MDWFRSWHGAPTHRLWRTIARRSGQPVMLVVTTAWALMDQASRNADHRGYVGNFDAEVFADFLCSSASEVSEDDIAAIYFALKNKGWIDENDHIASWDEHQPAREDTGASDRKRRQRGKERGENEGARHAMSRSVTQCHAASRPRAEETRTDTEERVVVDASCVHAREAAPDHDPAQVAARCREIIGVDQAWNGFVDHVEVRKWLEAGAQPERDIYPKIKELTAKREKPPNGWRYYTQAVADAKASNEQPMPEGNLDAAANPARKSGTPGDAPRRGQQTRPSVVASTRRVAAQGTAGQ